MGDLFKAITGGLARFVYAWMVPSAIALGLFWIFLLPRVRTAPLLRDLVRAGDSGLVGSALVFALAVLVLSVLFAYTSLPIYRVLEGYNLPPPLKRWLLRRQLQGWHRLQWEVARSRAMGRPLSGELLERLNSYPVERGIVRATRLGNALTAMESFGRTRYGLDSQTLWYELQAVVPEATRRHTEDGRAPVDFFISSLVHIGAFSMACFLVAGVKRDGYVLLLGVAVLPLIPLSYRLAVRNVKDWSHSVRALVNLGRIPLAQGMGLTMPETVQDEQNMWKTYLYAIEELDSRYTAFYDYYRRSPNPIKDPPGQADPSTF